MRPVTTICWCWLLILGAVWSSGSAFAAPCTTADRVWVASDMEVAGDVATTRAAWHQAVADTYGPVDTERWLRFVARSADLLKLDGGDWAPWAEGLATSNRALFDRLNTARAVQDQFTPGPSHVRHLVDPKSLRFEVFIDGVPYSGEILLGGHHVVQACHRRSGRWTGMVTGYLPDWRGPTFVRPRGVSFVAGTGVEAAFGRGWSTAKASEPDNKLAIPLELGLRIEHKGAWFRVLAAARFLATGSYLYLLPGDPIDLDDDTVEATQVQAGGLFAAGARAGPMLLGPQIGYLTPARFSTAWVVAWAPPKAISIEARVGANVLTDGTTEATASLMLFVVTGSAAAWGYQ